MQKISRTIKNMSSIVKEAFIHGRRDESCKRSSLKNTILIPRQI